MRCWRRASDASGPGCGRTTSNFCRKSRGRCGTSDLLDLCNVAAGRFDGYWEFALQLYDIAAGALILAEAGGRVTDTSGGAAWPENGLAATNSRLHPALLECFRKNRRISG